ncbi:hypothetical protein [Aquimarina celericrescens]|uniref:Histidine kinase N-terminal 7TM region domain-containing protein n=1 Tax=Aquimarina celericrescens TaxID=1964542 RepID=A0ABW5AZX9_9FLAO|nr:hypothetical protein [Aquimarina celericrescens]
MYYQLIINFFEIVAAVSGTIFLIKCRGSNHSRYLVYFLWFTVFFELIFAWLPYGVEIYESLAFLRNSIFEENIWIYNLYDIVSFSFYMIFFISFIERQKIRKMAMIAVSSFVIYLILSLIFFVDFSTEVSSINFSLGSLILLIIIASFFFQMLQSEKILNFYKIIPFYIGIGALIFHLSVAPILIYSKYYSNAKSPEFVKVYDLILTTANIFMYTCYTIGFIICLKKKKSY